MKDAFKATAAKTQRKSYPKPISFRPKDEAERQMIIELADGLPVSAFIRERIFGRDSPRTLRVVDRRAVAQVLACLGQSGIADNLALIADAVKIGALLVDDDVRENLNRACADIVVIRSALLKALSVKDGQ